MPDSKTKCHIFHGNPHSVQDELSHFLDSKNHVKVVSLVQSQSIVQLNSTDLPGMLITITMLYTETEDRERILGFTDKRELLT